jgi:uncharacterized RDD family membrane protein YckC
LNNKDKKDPPARKSMAMPVDDSVPRVRRKAPREDALTLEDSTRKVRTRNDLYNELTKNDREKADEDFFEFPSPLIRAIAFALDLVFIWALIQVAYHLSSEVETVINMFLNRYKLQPWFSHDVLMDVIVYSEIFVLFFICMVVPVAFFNTSFGKKAFKLRVRGDHKYTISLAQAFRREMIYKPLGVFLIIGFFMPFIDKKKKSLHDKMTGTLVVKD